MAKKISVPHYKQDTEHTCGPASLRMVTDFLGIVKTEDELARLAGTSEERGTSPEDLKRVAESLGLHVYVKSPSSVLELKNLIDSGLPVIVSYYDKVEEELHYSVIIGYQEDFLIFNDPWYGEEYRMKIVDFLPVWYDRDDLDKWIMVLSKVELELGKGTEEII
jgi:predicted double-glycine peptidase